MGALLRTLYLTFAHPSDGIIIKKTIDEQLLSINREMETEFNNIRKLTVNNIKNEEIKIEENTDKADDSSSSGMQGEL
jgi:hypothetical protein